MNYNCPYNASWKGYAENHVMKALMQINIALLDVIGYVINPDGYCFIITLKPFFIDYKINEMRQTIKSSLNRMLSMNCFNSRACNISYSLTV